MHFTIILSSENIFIIVLSIIINDVDLCTIFKCIPIPIFILFFHRAFKYYLVLLVLLYYTFSVTVELLL